MADVVGDVRKWNEVIQRFRELSDITGAEFNLKKFSDGKEVVEARIFFRPGKGE